MCRVWLVSMQEIRRLRFVCTPDHCGVILKVTGERIAEIAPNGAFVQ